MPLCSDNFKFRNLPPPLNSDTQLAYLKEVFTFVIDENPDDVNLTSTLLSVSKACLLSAGVNPASLDVIITLLEPMLKSSVASKRTVAMKVLESVLQAYADNLQPGHGVCLFI